MPQKKKPARTDGSKECITCGEDRPRTEYYAHPYMADGRLGRCKTCHKLEMRKARLANHEHYIMCKREYAKRPEQRRKSAERQAANPHKHSATSAVYRAVQAGKLKRQPCEECGKEETVAHHDDYRKKLDVRWLCRSHHALWHAENGEGAF